MSKKERQENTIDWGRIGLIFITGGIWAIEPPRTPPTPERWAKAPVASEKKPEIQFEGSERLTAWNSFVDGWAKEKNISLVQVSGLVAKRHNEKGELEILINQGRDTVTGQEKPWQSFGGKVGVGPGAEPNESPIEALIRECRDEAGKEIDPATVSYWKSYVQKPEPGATKTYNIHAFVMENCDWDADNLKLASDAKQIEWVNQKTAFVMPDGTPRPMTPQTRHILLSLGFVDPFGKQPIDDYNGDPTKL